MNVLWLALKGLAAGLAIAIPVGPVNVLVASRALAGGRRPGIVSGLGAAIADTLYGSIAGFSITFVIQFLLRQEFWIRVIGGILLVGIGVASVAGIYPARAAATLPISDSLKHFE